MINQDQYNRHVPPPPRRYLHPHEGISRVGGLASLSDAKGYAGESLSLW
jgi:hypothetical protein